MKRRDFLKGFAATSAGIAVTAGVGSIPNKAFASKKGKEDFGEIKSLKVYCVSG